MACLCQPSPQPESGLWLAAGVSGKAAPRRQPPEDQAPGRGLNYPLQSRQTGELPPTPRVWSERRLDLLCWATHGGLGKEKDPRNKARVQKLERRAENGEKERKLGFKGKRQGEAEKEGTQRGRQ